MDQSLQHAREGVMASGPDKPTDFSATDSALPYVSM